VITRSIHARAIVVKRLEAYKELASTPDVHIPNYIVKFVIDISKIKAQKLRTKKFMKTL
jgi:hypothetical protein